MQLSRDGVVVVHHDATLERTTNGSGPMAAQTADELARLDAGYHFGPSPVNFAATRTGVAAGGRGSTRCCAAIRDARCIIELKVNDPELAHRTIDAVRAAGAIERVALGSFGTRVLRAARAHEPRIPDRRVARGDAAGAVSIVGALAGPASGLRGVPGSRSVGLDARRLAALRA